MDYHELLGIVAAVITLLAGASYIVAIFRGETKPNRVTYWIWFVLGLLIFFTYLKSGGTTLWLQAVYVLNPFVIAVLSIWYGDGEGLHKGDKAALAIAGVSIPLWFLLKSVFGDTPEAALPILLLNLSADAIGALPTIVKAWKRPETEDRLAWFLCTVGALLNLLAVREWVAADIFWNGYYTAVALLIFIACSRRIKPHSKAGS